MSGAMLIRSITLSEDTSNAWRSVGGWYPRRERTLTEILSLYRRRVETDWPDLPIINLGNTSFNPTEEQMFQYGVDPKKVFNHGDNIRPLVRPGTTRLLLGNLMPPYPRNDNPIPIRYWVKAPGSKGKGKTLESGQKVPQIPKDWDLQLHVVGVEYRVITVDDRVVQVNKREGENGNRSYEWVGVTNAPRAVKQVSKDAARKLQGRTLIGWDIMYVPGMNRAFILEGNSCPGMNNATAQRVINQVYGRTYDDAS